MTNNKTIIRCMRCDFEGTEEDLVSILEEADYSESCFDSCPNCKTDSYLIDHDCGEFYGSVKLEDKKDG